MKQLAEALCRQTVTLYRRTGEGVLRQVLENCHLELEHVRREDVLGPERDTKFLLILPAREQLLQPGDRICAGIGPEEISWAQTGTFPQIDYVRLYHWQGEPCHMEAGRK